MLLFQDNVMTPFNMATTENKKNKSAQSFWSVKSGVVGDVRVLDLRCIVFFVSRLLLRRDSKRATERCSFSSLDNELMQRT